MKKYYKQIFTFLSDENQKRKNYGYRKSSSI